MGSAGEPTRSRACAGRTRTRKGSSMGERSRPAGFTLLEVMLALTALGMMAAICYGAFHVGMRAVERGEVAVTTGARMRVAFDVISRQLKSIVRYPAHDRENDEAY